MSRPLSHPTTKQIDIIKAIRIYTSRYGYPPSRRDLCQMVGVGLSTIASQLESLRKKGVIRWEPTIARSLRVVEDSPA